MALIVKRAKGKTAARSRRHFRVRKAVTGTSVRPRLVVGGAAGPRGGEVGRATRRQNRASGGRSCATAAWFC